MKKGKRKKAVALGYNPAKEHAPRIVSSGKGILAEKIIAIAREHGIPIHEDSDLVEILAVLDIEQEIPRELYMAVAEILAFLYGINKESRIVP